MHIPSLGRGVRATERMNVPFVERPTVARPEMILMATMGRQRAGETRVATALRLARVTGNPIIIYSGCSGGVGWLYITTLSADSRTCVSIHVALPRCELETCTTTVSLTEVNKMLCSTGPNVTVQTQNGQLQFVSAATAQPVVLPHLGAADCLLPDFRIEGPVMEVRLPKSALLNNLMQRPTPFAFGFRVEEGRTALLLYDEHGTEIRNVPVAENGPDMLVSHRFAADRVRLFLSQGRTSTVELALLVTSKCDPMVITTDTSWLNSVLVQAPLPCPLCPSEEVEDSVSITSACSHSFRHAAAAA